MTAPKGSAGGAKLTKAQRLKREERIIKDIKAGKLSYRLIADKHSVSLPTVNNKARKAGISRGRRKGAKVIVAGPRRTAKKATTRTARTAPAMRRTRATRTTRRVTSNGFGEAFRELVLQHHPNISLRQFDRLSQMIEKEIS